MTHRLRVAGLLAAGVSLVMAASTGVASAKPASQSYIELANLHTNKCADVAGESTSPGAIVHQWDCAQGDNQLWEPLDLGNGYFQLRNRHSNLCMDIRTGGPVNNGTLIQQWYCDTSISSEQWTFQSLVPTGDVYWLRTLAGGRCLDLFRGSGDNGATIEMWDCSTSSNAQSWYSIPVVK